MYHHSSQRQPGRHRKLIGRREPVARNRLMSLDLPELMGQLAKWDKAASIHLIFELNSPPSPPLPRGEIDYLDNYSRDQFTWLDFDPFVLPTGQTSLPRVACISRFSKDSQCYHYFHPRTLACIFTSLNRLEYANIWLAMPGLRLAALRKDMRTVFADLLANTPLPSLAKLEVHYDCDDPTNEKYPFGSFLDQDGNDSLSLTLRRLCRLPTLRQFLWSNKLRVATLLFI